MRSRVLRWASEQQKAAVEAGPNPLLLIGGYNAAKTWSAVIKLLILLDTYANSRAAVVRSIFKQMRKTTMETFYALCPPEAYDRGRRSDQDGICQLNNGSVIHFLGLDRPQSLDILAGLELNFGLVDQAEQIAERAWDTLDSRLARWGQAKIPQAMLAQYPEGWPWQNDMGEMVPPPFLFATANPPDDMDHFLFVRFAEESEEYAKWKEEGYRYIHMPSYSNKFASEANLRKLRSKDPIFVRKYYEGLWAVPEGNIFTIDPQSIIEPSEELLNHIINTMRLHRSLDHGDSEPTSVHWYGTDRDNNVFVYREHYLGGPSVKVHREIIHQLSLRDVPQASEYNTYRYSSQIADPSIFSISRGRTVNKPPEWSIADEWCDTRVMPRETAIYWQAAPIQRSEGVSYDLATRARVKAYLEPDPLHANPITGQKPAPRVYFLKRTDKYPNGCYHIIKEVRGQRKKQVGEREGRPVYSDERDKTIVDHAYDDFKYFLISRPELAVEKKVYDPNVINIRELMEQSGRNARRRAVSRIGGY